MKRTIYSDNQGYLTPQVVIILGLITLFAGLTLLFNTELFQKVKDQPSTSSPIVSPEPSPRPSPYESTKSGACAQVITPAINPKTGERKEFPTPCDVPEGWQTVR